MSKGESSGARKRRSDKGISKKRGKPAGDVVGERFIREQANDRWPGSRQMDLYFELNTSKEKRPSPTRRVKAPVFAFALMESVNDRKALDKLLIAASLKVKKVRRYPGWILQQTYNLKNRPIQII